ncbi:MAG: C39 family peptidase [Nocardioidaceae bacterium]
MRVAPARRPGNLRIGGWSARLTVPAVAATLALTLAMSDASGAGRASGVSSDASTTPTDFHAWSSLKDFAGGSTTGGATVVTKGGGALTLRPGTTTGTWTSKAHAPEFGITELIASWQAATPGDSWVDTQLSVQVGGRWSPWFSMGKWAFDTTAIKRTSVPSQNNAFGYISIDTYFAHSGDSAAAYRLRERLHGSADARPVVGQVAAVAFDPQPPTYHPSSTTMTRTIDLDVPQLSQETHRNEYPKFGGGGEAWCSPTSTEMVVEYWGEGPTHKQLRQLPLDPAFDRHGRKDGAVDWAAIHTFDKNYDGTGNWPFNTAYAAHYGLDASVRQYDSLNALEYWVKRGVPTVVSIAWNNNSKNQRMHLDGADIDSTGGHLMVVRGFTADGNVIANDPASPDNAAVRHIYQRDQFEFLWLHASAGVVYLIKR